MAGINVPLQPVKHQYIITEKIEGLATDAPTIRDPDRRTYFKEEVGGLVMGGYEPTRSLDHRRRPRRLPVPPVRRRFRPFRAAYDAGHRPRAGARDHRRQADDQRAGELYARRQLHPRRGARNAQHVRRRRLQRLRHRLGRRRGLGAGRMGRHAARRRWTCGSSISAASPRCTATATGCATARSRPMASTTPSPSRTRNTRAAARASSRRSTTG
jgi:hypothetical protein